MTGRVLTGAAAAAAVAVPAFASGAYFPSEWGLLLLSLALVVIAAAAAAELPGFGRFELLLLSALAGLAAWQLLSALWAPGPDGPVLEAERTLVYLAAATALLVAVRREWVTALLGGLVVGTVIVAAAGLGDRVLRGELGDPADPVSGIRLVEPIGYANAIGILVVLGGLLAAALALRVGAYGAALCGGALVPLASTLAFTFSRGALIALGGGAAVLLVLEWERGRAFAGLLLLAAAPAAAAFLSLRSPLADALTSPAQADAAGQRLAWQLALLTLGGAAAGLLGRGVAARLAPIAIALAGVGVVAAIVLVIVAGPGSLLDDARARFREQPAVAGSASPGRLISLSSSGRFAYWSVAGGMVAREPLLGEGAGSYERWWLQERPVASPARDAHNLYLETLAELGPVGLAFLLAALAAPLLTLRRHVRHPGVPAAGAAYAAFLVHAGLDWDWEIPAVTLIALACGASLLVLARSRAAAPLRTPHRGGAIAAASVLAAAAVVVHVGNRAAAASEEDLLRADVAGAVAEARRSRSWQPWAALPLRLLGEAELAGGRDGDAAHSLHRALARDPESWRAWYDLAIVTSGREQREAVRRAAALNPLGPEVAELRDELRRPLTNS